MLAQLWTTVFDVLPIIAVVFGFQFLVIRRKIDNLPKIAAGFAMVVLGLAVFLVGLDMALFPIGEMMAVQLVAAEFLPALADGQQRHWSHFYWVYLFAFAIGASATIAEPALIAVSMKAAQISGGTLDAFWLRVAVAIGVAFGISLGAWRIVTGLPLYWFVLTAYGLVILQTWRAPRNIIPLAFDSGGVTTSTITVPIIAAVGIGLASAIPGRDPLLDGFGMIALACLFPIITVMGYAQLADYRQRRRSPS
jgi:hypothetical protein